MSNLIELEEMKRERIAYETSELKSKLMMTYANNIINYFNNKFRNGDFMLDILADFFMSDAEIDEIVSVTIKYEYNDIYVCQMFNNEQGIHILENMRVYANDKSLLTTALSSLVTKFGYNLELPTKYSIIVSTKSFIYTCNSMINGELYFNCTDKIDF
jgi:hypothetical protein